MNWRGRARTAALELSTGRGAPGRLHYRPADPGRGRGVQRARQPSPHSRPLEGLHAIEESPWGEWFGKPLSAHGLSRLLKPYRIKTMPVRVDGETVRGYKAEQFADAYARVVAVTGVTGVTSQASSDAGGNACNASNASTREQGGEGEKLHPGDALEAALLDAFPDAAVLADDGPPWHTQGQGRFGVVQVRDVPGRNTTRAEGAA